LWNGYRTNLRFYAVLRGRSPREAVRAFTIAGALLNLAATGLDRLVALGPPGFGAIGTALLRRS
jgi:hypothetical protein